MSTKSKRIYNKPTSTP